MHGEVDDARRVGSLLVLDERGATEIERWRSFVSTPRAALPPYLAGSTIDARLGGRLATVDTVIDAFSSFQTAMPVLDASVTAAITEESGMTFQHRRCA